MNETIKMNPLGSEKISKLMLKFAIPSIIAMMCTSIGLLFGIGGASS